MTISTLKHHKFLPHVPVLLPETVVNLVKAESTFVPNPQIEIQIEAGWREVTERMSKRNWLYFDGPLLRVEQVEVTETGLSVQISEGETYRQVIGLRAHVPETFLSLQKSSLPNALSVIALIKTADNQLVLNQRASGDWEESYELIGGFVRVGTTDLVSSINSFLEKDLSIGVTDIAQHLLLSIGHYPVILETMAVFEITLNITLAELLIRSDNAETIQAINVQENTEECIKKTISNTVMHPPSLTILSHFYST